MALVELYQRKVEYTDQDGVKKNAINLFLQCGNQIIPIEVKYFKNKETGRDEHYAPRKSVVVAFAGEYPEKK